MPIPAPNLYPPFNILRVSHATLVVGDLQRSRAFYADVLGMQVTDEAGDVVYLRAMEERGHHSLVLRQGASPAVGALGFKLFDEQDLEKAAAFFSGRGRPVEWIDRAHQSPTLRTSSPQGIPLEFHARMDRLPPIHQQYGLYRGVRPLRIDHFNCLSPDVDEAVAFFGEIGFRVTEYTEDDATKRVVAAWMHRKGTSHDIAFMNGVGPKLHHLAFWVPGPLSIIDLLDQMATTGYVSNIERGPGRHGISNAFFLYVRDPDGHRIELYCSDYQTVDPDLEPIRWSLDDPQRKTLWGTPSPPSFYEEATEFESAIQSAPELKTPSIIAS